MYESHKRKPQKQGREGLRFCGTKLEQELVLEESGIRIARRATVAQHEHNVHKSNKMKIRPLRSSSNSSSLKPKKLTLFHANSIRQMKALRPNILLQGD
jgi:hypothetical protein